MALHFISTSKHKVEEFKKSLSPEVKFDQLELNLDEIQSLDPKEVITHKLNEARKLHSGELMVEDSSLCLDALNGFPGPLVKHFFKSIGNDGLLKIVESFNCNTVQARTMIGYFDGKEILFFEGVAKGKLVHIRRNSDFGFDPIFVPEGQNKTFSESLEYFFIL